MDKDTISFCVLLGSVGAGAVFISLCSLFAGVYPVFALFGGAGITCLSALAINLYLKKNFGEKRPPW